ncbi:hypothetical protein DOTSEDRAFT_33332 [Dothistroma septosporum NZE10]|uniref:Uncharacterized protein n=1 Tax=Dothistroma septosporum (strain NZE10 / CBS 128990) TaxID=675120 RepID=N1PX39_DOTSN|nr:hypothetical protein DOTSEDRAFT_33332 [Dothistroma septosporum NZE10]
MAIQTCRMPTLATNGRASRGEGKRFIVERGLPTTPSTCQSAYTMRRQALAVILQATTAHEDKLPNSDRRHLQPSHQPDCTVDIDEGDTQDTTRERWLHKLRRDGKSLDTSIHLLPHDDVLGDFQIPAA